MATRNSGVRLLTLPLAAVRHAKEGQRRLGRQGGAEQKSLHEIAVVRGHEKTLRFGLHAFCGDGQSEAVRQGDGGGADGDIVAVALDVADEALVELEGVDRQQLEIAE